MDDFPLLNLLSTFSSCRRRRRKRTDFETDILWRLYELLHNEFAKICLDHVMLARDRRQETMTFDELLNSATIELFSEKSKDQIEQIHTDLKGGSKVSRNDDLEKLASTSVVSLFHTILNRVEKRYYRQSWRFGLELHDTMDVPEKPLASHHQESVEALPSPALQLRFKIDPWESDSMDSVKFKSALSNLSFDERSLLFERFVEQSSITAIAAKRRASYSSTAVKLFRVKERFRDLLAKEGYFQSPDRHS
jgi:DNA-directed RNA polymerase specialized sigma24 family protein